jgi:hypothetical protein
MRTDEIDADLQTRERPRRRDFDEKIVLELIGKSAVIAVQSETMADLMHRDCEQVYATHGVARRLAENPSIVEQSPREISLISRVARVFGVVPRGRIGEPTGNLSCGEVLTVFLKRIRGFPG